MASILSSDTNQKQPANKEERKGSSHDSSSNNTAVLQSEEEDVLASLGTTRAEASNYESNVLRQATHKLAPTLRLSKPSKQQSQQPTAEFLRGPQEEELLLDPEVGFPDLISTTSLLPFSTVQQQQQRGSAGAAAYKAARTNNRQVILQVLQQLQSQIIRNAANVSVEQMRVLIMKEQMLLSMLGGSQQSKRQSTQEVWKQQESVTQGIYEQHERHAGGSQTSSKRRGRVPMMEHKQLNGSSNNNNVIPGSSSLAKATAQLRRSRAKKGGWKDWSSDEEEEDEDDPAAYSVLAEMNSSRRQQTRTPKQQKAALNKLRPNNQKRRASLSRRRAAPTTQRGRRGQAASNRIGRNIVGDNRNSTVIPLEEDFTSSGRPKRKRTVVASYADNDAYVEEEDAIEEEEDEEINVDMDGVGGDENDKDDNNDNTMLATTPDSNESTQVGTTTDVRIKEEENASADTEDTNTTTTVDRPVDYFPKNDTNIDNFSEQTDQTVSKASARVAIKDEPPQQKCYVTCPLCQESWTPSSPDTVDVELSQHMAQCQNGGGGRRSNRRRTTPAIYADIEDEAGGDSDDGFETSSRSRREPKRRRANRNDIKDNTRTYVEDTQFTFDDDMDGEEDGARTEDEEGEDDDKFIFDNDVEDEDEALEVGEYDEEGEVPLEKPTAVDDFRLDDYEDRVDYWRLYGVGQMRDMSNLRAEGEMDPGAVTYQGGLHIPAWMNNRLFAYQRTGLEWMWTLHQQQAGGVCGDEMGLGKTVQVASFLGAMAASRQLKGVLIISPATMLQHWLSELAVWAPGLRRVLIHSSGDTNGNTSLDTPTRNLNNQASAIFGNLQKWLKRARADYVHERIRDPHGAGNGDDDEPDDSFCGTGYAVVTTYEHVRRNQDIYVNHRWSYVVMDEAQKIRNPQADITLAVKRLRTPHRIAMTGTPIQNDLRELWSLFDFVFPGRLGTLPAFEQEFAETIKRGGYSNASPVQVQLAYRCSLILRDLIDPYLLRRLKSEVAEVRRMPSKTEHVLFCRLSRRQRRMYEAYLASDTVRRIFKGSAMLFAAVTMLRKICNHPDLVLSDSSDDTLEAFLRNGCVPEHEVMEDEEDEDEDEFPMFDPDNVSDDLASRAGKFEVLARILPLWKKQGHRVLIFSQWTKMLNLIQQFVTMQGWKFGRIDGKTNVASRQRLVDTFNSDDSYFGMLCTTRTGGVGLNLTGANRIILYDIDWNPQTDAQARERAWRFGQEKQVTVYRFITAGTIEEKMYQRQIFKTALTNKVLHDPRQRRLFSQKDLHDLLTLQPDNGTARAGGDEIIETTNRVAKANRRGSDGGAFNTSEVSKDDGETLKSVMKSKGLAGVFDHNFVDPSASGGNKSASIREMEEQAKRVAKEAAQALQASVDQAVADEDDPFKPTWTGGPESRFGGGNVGSQRRVSGSAAFAGRRKAGVREPAVTSGKTSESLLASLKQQNEAIKTGGKRRPSQTSSDKGTIAGQDGKYAKLMLRIRNYVRSNAPTTDQLLDEFVSISSDDAAIFKRLLNSVAKPEGGRWKLLPDHQ